MPACPKPGRIRLTGEHLAWLRRACWLRDEGFCRVCRCMTNPDAPAWAPNKYDMAHIKSRGAGGSDTLENVRTLCHKCHMREHNAGRKQ